MEVRREEGKEGTRGRGEGAGGRASLHHIQVSWFVSLDITYLTKTCFPVLNMSAFLIRSVYISKSAGDNTRSCRTRLFTVVVVVFPVSAFCPCL